ncbi:MAG: RNA polymerase sigma factor [Deltaproteobacteria bacterium]
MPIATAGRWNNSEVGLFREAELPAAVDSSNTPHVDTLEDIYTRYNSRVYYLCLQMTGNVEDAEDLSQEAFLRMMQKLDSFRGESAFYTWFRRLAINVVLLKFQKASWRREVSLEELAEPGNCLEPRPQRAFASVDLGLMGAVDRIALERAMERLAPGLKAVFILHDIEGYEHPEIAALLGCSVGTSKSQLHKARLRLRELLNESGCERERAPAPVGRASSSPASMREALKFTGAALRQRLAA